MMDLSQLGLLFNSHPWDRSLVQHLI